MLRSLTCIFTCLNLGVLFLAPASCRLLCGSCQHRQHPGIPAHPTRSYTRLSGFPGRVTYLVIDIDLVDARGAEKCQPPLPFGLSAARLGNLGPQPSVRYLVSDQDRPDNARRIFHAVFLLTSAQRSFSSKTSSSQHISHSFLKRRGYRCYCASGPHPSERIDSFFE